MFKPIASPVSSEMTTKATTKLTSVKVGSLRFEKNLFGWGVDTDALACSIAHFLEYATHHLPPTARNHIPTAFRN